jgi:hypothetical protein
VQISELRNVVHARSLEFVWDQWAQMGVLATSRRQDDWAADPEALLLLTLEVGRHDARLFEEVSDWMVRNERLMSVRRLRNLCRDDTDKALADAFLSSVARWRPRPRLAGDRTASQVGQSRGEPFFRDGSVPIRRTPDAGFLKHGWLKPLVEPSGKSQAPNLVAPINFAFRLREILGVGARAEVVRILLTVNAPRLSTQAVADSAGFAKRNVQEALTSLHVAGVINGSTLSNQHRYDIDRDRWAELLGLTRLPEYRDWPRLLHALRRLVRWLGDERLDELSDYMLASAARSLGDDIGPDLAYAGVRVDKQGEPGAAYWQTFEQLTGATLDALA